MTDIDAVVLSLGRIQLLGKQVRHLVGILTICGAHLDMGTQFC